MQALLFLLLTFGVVLLPQEKAETSSTYSWETNYGPLTLQMLPERKVEGHYKRQNGAIWGTFRGRRKAKGVIEGVWLQSHSAQRCDTALEGTYYWGRARWWVSGYDITGFWSYCEKEDASGGTWEGKGKIFVYE